jgi:glyoxylase-like metal-dependent hydrolase (beta-lactamase superfamily II)
VIRTAVLHWAPGFPPGQDWRTPGVITDDRGWAVIDMIGMVVRTPASLIVIDPASWTSDEQHEGFDIVAGRSIDDAITALGFASEVFTHVVVTHGHSDHFSGLARPGADGPEPRFSNAVHLLPTADWGSMIQSAPVQDLLTPVDAEHEVDEFVTLLPAPGESDGHQIVRIADGDERVFYLGDLFHFPAEVEHLDWGPGHADHVLLQDSRRRLLAQAGGPDSTLVFSHGRFPGWGRADRTGDSWHWHYLE